MVNDSIDWEPLDIRWDADGVVPAVLYESSTHEVLMHSHMNSDALNLTLREERVYLWSKSRATLWMKGEQSGFIMALRGVRVDEDQKSLLVLVRLEEPGGACHLGYRSCFYREISALNGSYGLTPTTDRAFDPQIAYRTAQ